MINSIVLPDGAGTYTLPNTNVILQGVDGFGTPDPKLGQHEYSNAIGGLFLSQFYKTRRISLDGFIVASTVATYASVRRALEEAFTFSNAEKTITYTTDDGLQVTANAIIATPLQLQIVAGQVTGCGFHVELDCADPLFYSVAAASTQGGVATVTGGIILPATLPFTLTGALNGLVTVTNNGLVAVSPDSVTIQGPGSSFALSNRTTGDDFFYNASLITGDSVVFDFKRHTATKNGTTNVYGNVSGTWWKLAKGANTIILTCGGSNTTDTKFILGSRDAWLAL
jgi:hypothetical protein